MSTKPHDVVDLRLAPVALHLDRRIEELGRLSADALRNRVELDNDRPARTRADREQDLLASITRFIDLGGWQLSWDPRGVRLSHSAHSVVLGLPVGLQEFVTAAAKTSAS